MKRKLHINVKPNNGPAFGFEVVTELRDMEIMALFTNKYEDEISKIHPCPVVEMECKYYSWQEDGNGEVAICFCGHPANKDKQEGNCTKELCPLPRLMP